MRLKYYVNFKMFFKVMKVCYWVYILH